MCFLFVRHFHLHLDVLFNDLSYLLLLPVTVATSTHLLVFSLPGVLELLLLVDRLGPEMDFLQLEHVEDIKDGVYPLVHIHSQSSLDPLHVGFQFLLHIFSGKFNCINQLLLS